MTPGWQDWKRSGVNRMQFTSQFKIPDKRQGGGQNICREAFRLAIRVRHPDSARLNGGMRISIRTGCLSAILTLVCPLAGAEPTSLVDVEGREIRVEVVSVADGEVTIVFNGKKVGLPMARLDEASRKRVETVLGEKAKERETRLAERMDLPNGGKIVPGKLQTFVLEATDKDREHAKCEGLRTITVSVAFPEGFDPDRKWPVFFSNDTSPGKNAGVTRTYQGAANRLGYVVIGAQGEGAPGADKESIKTLSNWDARGRVTRRAIDELAKRWPLIMESDWSYGGFSGGAKNCCYLAVYLFETYKDQAERLPVGFYMGGCNEMKMSHAIEAYGSKSQPFKEAAFFVSNGDGDKVASPEDGRRVEDLLNKDGFRLVKKAVYPGGHHFHEPHFTEALVWFKELAEASK
jgi:predicted esterase